MKKNIVQIYEIQTQQEAEILIDLGVDHIGSVLISEDNWKEPEIKDTIDLVKQTSFSKTSLIPLFNTPDAIFKVLDYYQPDIIHFCEILAHEKKILPKCKDLIQLQANIKQKFSKVKIMRSIPIAQTGQSKRIPSLEAAKMFEPVSDYFLTDTIILSDKSSNKSIQPVTGFVGITGITCDWDVAANLVKKSQIPVILAGGIDPENVSQGILKTRPAGIDSCSGTNILDKNGRPIRFKKDMKKVQNLVEKARACFKGF